MTFNQNDIKNHFTYFPEKSNFDINYNSDVEVFVFIKYTSTQRASESYYDDDDGETTSQRGKHFISSPYSWGEGGVALELQTEGIFSACFHWPCCRFLFD